jgi:hypothetical protein
VELITYHPGNDFVEFIRDRSIPAAHVQACGFLRMGRADICLQVVDKIERTAIGKFRSLVCNLPGQKAVPCSTTPVKDQSE